MLTLFTTPQNGFGMDIFNAVSSSNVGEVNRLIEDGVDLDTPDKFGWTPIFIAVSRCDEKIASLLIDAGADIYKIDNYGFGIFNYICSSSYDKEIKENILNDIINKRARILKGLDFEDEVSELIKAIIRDDFNELIKLKTNGANVNSEGKYGWTPLMHAIASCNKRITKYLLENGADISKFSKNMEAFICVKVTDYDEKDFFTIKSMIDQAKAGKKSIEDTSGIKLIRPKIGDPILP
jgi:ankyrin repeat protein